MHGTGGVSEMNPQTGYPGVWIRIQHRFGPRMMEWFMAFHTIGWGYVLLLPDRLFDQPACQASIA